MTALGGMDWRDLGINQKADAVIRTKGINGLRQK